MTAAPTTDQTTYAAPLTGAPACPKCGGRMWDNRATKRNPKAPDFRCRTPECDGRVWPGQHHAALPIVTAPLAGQGARPAPGGDGAGEGGQGREPGSAPAPEAGDLVSPSLRDAYLSLTDFVLGEVRPRYEAKGLTCSADTIARMVAALLLGARTDGGGR